MRILHSLALAGVAFGQINLDPVSFFVGNAHLTSLVDNVVRLHHTFLFPDIPRDEWVNHPDHEGLDYIDEEGKYRGWFPFSTMLVQMEGLNIIVDDANGIVDPPFFSEIPLVDLTDQLNRLGVREEDIDYVIHTHLHTDHTGWDVTNKKRGTKNNTSLPPLHSTHNYSDADVRVTFPSARHIIQQSEVDWWLATPERRAECNWDVILAPVQRAGLIDLIQGTREIVPGFEIFPCVGHTIGHQCVRIRSQGATALIIGDAMHHVVQVQLPQWSPPWDFNQDQSSVSRAELAASIVDDPRAVIIGPHLPFPGVGVVITHPNPNPGEVGRLYVPVDFSKLQESKEISTN